MIKSALSLVILLVFQTSANAQDTIRTVYELLYQGDANGAYRQFRTLSDRDPQSLAASFGVLTALYDRGLDDPELQKEFEQRIDQLIQKASDRYEKDKRDTGALFYLEQSYLNRARYRADFDKGMWGAARDGIKAKKYGDEYIKVDPNRADAYLALGLYNYYIEILPTFFKFIRSVLLMPAGNRDEGLKQLERVAAAGEHWSPFAQNSLIEIYELENRFDDALRVAENLQNKYPENPEFVFEAASLYANSQVEQYDRAVQLYTHIIQRVEQKHPNYRPERIYQATLNLAWLRQEQWRFEEAIALLNPAIDSNVEKPDWVMPRFLLSRANFRVRIGDGRYVDDDRRVLAQPKWKKWHKNAQEQINVYAQRRQSGEAAVFTELIPANRLVAEHQWDQARQEYERIRARRPDDWQVRYRLAYLEFDRRDYDRAYVAFSQIVNNNPANAPNWLKASAMLYLARVFDIRKDRDQALKLYKRVVDEYEHEAAAESARFGLLTPYSPRKRP